jgi:hypothetical protein
MRSRKVLLALIGASFLAAPSGLAEDFRSELVGRWVGESKCTAVRPACHDEVASYRISVKDNEESTVAVSFNKMVNGEEIVMGVLDLEVGRSERVLWAEYNQGDLHMLWRFEWKGMEMTGTLTEPPGGPVIRNIKLNKQ